MLSSSAKSPEAPLRIGARVAVTSTRQDCHFVMQRVNIQPLVNPGDLMRLMMKRITLRQ